VTAFVVILTVVAAVALGVIGVAIISADIHITRLEKRVEYLERWADDVGNWARGELRAGNLSLRDEHPNAPRRATGGPVPDLPKP
jgi:hypothetical protein